MSSFSTVNLLDVENSVGERAPGIEGRFARKHLDSRDLGVSLFRYAPNLRSPKAHSHREQEEAYVVVSGSGRMLLDGEIIEAPPVGCRARRARGRARLRGRPRWPGDRRDRRPQARGGRRRHGRGRLARRGVAAAACRRARMGPTPRARLRVPGSACQAPCARLGVPDSACQAPRARLGVPLRSHQ